MDSSITVLLKFLALFVSEILTIDKNRDENVSALEIIGAALIILGKSQELAYVFNNIGEDFAKINNILENENDSFDRLIDEIIALDFLPSERDKLEVPIKKTLIALMHLQDATRSWINSGTQTAPDAEMRKQIREVLKIGMIRPSKPA